MQDSELHITDLSPEGLGIANWLRPDGLVRPCLVHSSLPDETVEASVFRTKKNKTASFAAKITSIKSASPHRVEPRCKHFGSCGGCVWQHMAYAEQLAVKEARIKKLFDPDTQILPIIACPSPWQYRNKMEFSFSQDAKGSKFLGLILQGSKGRVFTLEECHLMNPWVAQTVTQVYKWWLDSPLLAYYMPKDRGSLRNITVRESHATLDRVIILTVSGNPEFAIKRSELDRLVHLLQEVATPNDGAS
jgi:23S rRNA (uracil1939-C5)-methyltransferase